MKKWTIIVLFVLVAALGICITGWVGASKTMRAQSKHITEQSMVIDSLLNIPPAIVLSPTLNVQDKSSFKILGKGNSGTINAPTERIYILKVEMDSSNIIVQAK